MGETRCLGCNTEHLSHHLRIPYETHPLDVPMRLKGSLRLLIGNWRAEYNTLRLARRGWQASSCKKLGKVEA